MSNLLCPSMGETIERAFEIKAGDMPGSFEGYGAVFGNRDSDGDVVNAGAFAASLKERKPALLWQHDKKQPIGVLDEVREDERGLFVKGRLSMEGRGREAYDLLKMGALNGLSIGFITREANRDSVQGARLITKADLMEVSLVTFPANELARVASVKAAGDVDDARSFERFLRESGFSRTRAKAITAKGFKSTDLSAGESAEIAAMIYDLKQRQERLEKKRQWERMVVYAAPLTWGPQLPLGHFLMTDAKKATYLHLSFSHNVQSAAAFQVEVEYISPTGKKADIFTNPSSLKLELAKNSVVHPKIRAKSTLNGFNIEVRYSL